MKSSKGRMPISLAFKSFRRLQERRLQRVGLHRGEARRNDPACTYVTSVSFMPNLFKHCDGCGVVRAADAAHAEFLAS